MTNLEKTSKDYKIQVDENEKLKERLNLLIKQNQKLLTGISKTSDQKEITLPKSNITITNENQTIENTATKYDNEISNLKNLINDKCKNFELNIKQVEEKLNNKPNQSNNVYNELNNSPNCKVSNLNLTKQEVKLQKPMKSLESFQDDEVNDYSHKFSQENKNVNEFSKFPILKEKIDYKSLILKVYNLFN